MIKEWNKETSLRWKRRRDVESLVFDVARWCTNNLSSNEKLPKVWVDWKRQKRCYGEYDYADNEIIVYPLIHEKVEDIIDTTIHEWIHFLQDTEEIIDSIKRYKHYKDANPKELEAVELAKKYTKSYLKENKQ